MTAYRTRFDSSFFKAGLLRSAFAPRKPRRPLVRLALGLVGLGLLLLLVFFSVFVGIAMLTAGVVYRLWKRGKPLARDPRVVDGQYRIVGKAALPSA